MGNKPIWTTVRGWEKEAEQGLLAAFAKQLVEGAIYVEIGSEHGMSASIIALHAPFSPDIYCVEINENAQFLENIRNANIDSEFIYPIFGDSKTVKIPKQILEDGIDLLFVDGDHSFEGALADLERWSHYVNSNGVILVHDCACKTNLNPHALHFPVYAAVQHFLASSGLWRVAFTVDTMMVLVRS